MKFKLVESIDDRLVEVKAIEWTDEQIADIIDMYTSQGLRLDEIAAKYNVAARTIGKTLMRNNIQLRSKGKLKKKYPVYLNTISFIGDIRGGRDLSNSISLEYKPSIKLGDYTLSDINQIASNLRKKITDKERPNGSEILAFYMRLLQEGTIKQLVSDILNIDSNQSERRSLYVSKGFHILTVDDEVMIRENDLIDFYSYQKIAEEWLTELGSKVEGWEEPLSDSGNYLKELALQYRKSTVGVEDYKKVIKKYSLNDIIYSLFDKHGNRIDPINYKKKINEIPYEDEFNISSLEDLQKRFRDFKRTRDVLYGYLDNKSRIVYVGITQDPYSRGDAYAKSDQEKRILAKALIMKMITKLIIFKSYLPTAYSESSSKLLRWLEIEFAEKIFKTYHPENKDKSFEELIEAGTLNIDKPGKNQSKYIINSIQNYVAKLAANSLLSKSEYENHIRSAFGDDTVKKIWNSRYSYKTFYLKEYIKNHENSWKYDFLVKKVGQGKSEYLYPQITLAELNALMDKAGLSKDQKSMVRKDWKKAHDKTNQANIDDLDDTINGDYYK